MSKLTCESAYGILISSTTPSGGGNFIFVWRHRGFPCRQRICDVTVINIDEVIRVNVRVTSSPTWIGDDDRFGTRQRSSSTSDVIKPYYVMSVLHHQQRCDVITCTDQFTCKMTSSLLRHHQHKITDSTVFIYQTFEVYFIEYSF